MSELKLSDEAGKLLRIVQTADNDIGVSKEVMRVANESKSQLSKQSVEFINGKRKIKLSEICAKHRRKLFLRALWSARGIVKTACQSAGCSRDFYVRGMRNDPDFRIAVEMIQEDAIDFAEGKLLENIEKGYEASTIFYLKTKAKHRGYNERELIGVNPNNEIKSLTDVELNERIEQLARAIRSAGGKEEEAT